MAAAAKDSPTPEPLSIRQPVRVAIGATILYLILLGFCYLAADNLIQNRGVSTASLVCSGVWLIIVIAVVWGFARQEGGFGQLLVHVLGNYSQKHFLQIETDSAGPIFSYGYHFFGGRFYYLRVALDGITSLSWSAGQGSHMSGRDLADWNVAIWFERSATRTPLEPNFPKRDTDLKIVGMSGSRSEIDAFGNDIVQFLRSAGLALEPDAEGRKFVARR